jgi:DNA-binding transcriptional LysR family regulator
MEQAQAVAGWSGRTGAEHSSGVELRHLRYFVAVADAGTFTEAAERMFVAQPTLSQQIRRLEEFVGTRLLHRQRDGVRLTTAGAVLLEASRDVLSLMEHGMSRTRHAAGLGRQRLRVVVPPRLPDALAIQATSALRRAADAANVDVVWLENALDADFSLVRDRQADAGLGWATADPGLLPAPLDAMSLGEYEPEAWVPAWHPAAARGTVSLGELAGMRVIHGPRRAVPATYDAWSRVLRMADPRFAFTDPPFRHSPQVALAFAASGDAAAGPPTAVLTGPSVRRGSLPTEPGAHHMVPVAVADHELTATAALVWSGDLPRPLQQLLFDAADAATERYASPAGR